MKQRTPLPLTEFVVLLALMISIIAMSIDMMLPALDVIGQDLGVADPNDAQLVVVALVLGFSIGQVFAGPLSDTLGRKPVIYLGYAIFVVGCGLSMWATNWETMIVGRVLQGIGAAAPRIVTMALVRDGYEGRAMARILSIVSGIFILVPTVAPALGYGVVQISGWRGIFGVFIFLSVITWVWFALRQPETLDIENRRAFSLSNIWSGTLEILRSRTAVGYTAVLGLIFGAFLGYLSVAQQVFEITFHTGPMFVIYFGVGALTIGLASFVNSSLVIRLGMRRLIWISTLALAGISILFAIPVYLAAGVPDFWLFMAWLLAAFFCIGILFGNLNAIAMEPLGNIAGLGAALVGSLSNFVSLPLGLMIGQGFDGGLTSLVLGFAGLSLLALVIIVWTERP